MGKSCGKILWEKLVGKSCGKSCAGKSCGKILWEILLVGKSCGKSCSGKILQENLVGNLVENLAGQGGGEKASLRKAVIGRNLAFGIG